MRKLIERYMAIGCQYRNSEKELTRAAVKRNLERMKRFLDWGYEQFSYSFPIKLMVFPEYSVSGYPAGSNEEALRVAEEIPGESTDVVGGWAKEYDTYIVVGMGNKLKEYPKTQFDTAVIMNPKGRVELVYRKTNPWIPDEYWPSPHDFLDTWNFKKYPIFPVAKTEIGNLGVYICNDGMTPEPARQLAFNGAEILIRPELLMDPWIIPPLEYSELRTRWNSVMNVAYGIAVNAAWEPENSPPYPMQGGSHMTDYEGRILSACPKAAVEGYCFMNIDIGQLRAYRTTMMTHNGLNSFKGDLYDYFKRPIMYPCHPQISKDEKWDYKKSREVCSMAMKRFWDDYYKDAVK